MIRKITDGKVIGDEIYKENNDTSIIKRPLEWGRQLKGELTYVAFTVPALIL